MSSSQSRGLPSSSPDVGFDVGDYSEHLSYLSALARGSKDSEQKSSDKVNPSAKSDSKKPRARFEIDDSDEPDEVEEEDSEKKKTRLRRTKKRRAPRARKLRLLCADATKRTTTTRTQSRPSAHSMSVG